MRFAKVIVVCSSLAAGANGATAQSAHDTAFRAAYCAGALKESIRALREHQPSVSECAADWLKLSFASPADCIISMQALTEASVALQSVLAEKHKRYVQYLAIWMATNRTGNSALQVLALKGERDASSKSATPVNPRCRALAGDAFVNCIAESDQVHANIVKCQHMPDNLPF